ncbi:periplasmic component of amino acid ABC-type transporter/signal transduction system [Sphaerochaeta pleomorpha str. Grapes]|uniref:Periplasmic component of amino acid ABC-type transporter/signal transduction system n=1 Tax=Sphaerochaeta pleomorpha (strain ATCC BAA-1885 / DSM 22778 / Grapes) TaxID=158190 RepID=G8QTQ4_SPHPG|nr:ABC transporter substrate-binding protein [Sphaerochaeta pleomorpha]AEV28019.1 periplasmic component of amino acid ABC-type transporter/signal transduction system [Sphaerochaeta pleomorpha str. Grapes]
MKITKKLGFVLVTVVLLGFFSNSLVFANGTKESPATIAFAGSGGYPPFNYMTDEGSVIGFDVDVAKEIAKRLGKEMEYKTTAWDGIIEGLRAKRYDAILGSMGITEAREKVVDFSIPYYYSGPQLIVRRDSTIKGVSDLKATSRVGLVTGTTFEEDAAKLGVVTKLYEDDNQTLMELINGRLDGVLTDRIVGLNAIGKLQGGEQLMLVGSVLRSEKMGIAFHDGDDALRTQVNAILVQMQEDGTLATISAKWFGGEDITHE